MSGMCLTDLAGFSTLQELDYTSHADKAGLDLSACCSLRKVRISDVNGKSALSTLNLAGCSSLEQLDFDSDSTFRRLKKLDLSFCTRLTHLKCGRAGLKSLDVSFCPLLTSLDVHHSRKLKTLCTTNCNKLLYINSGGCSKLRVRTRCVCCQPRCQVFSDEGSGRTGYMYCISKHSLRLLVSKVLEIVGTQHGVSERCGTCAQEYKIKYYSWQVNNLQSSFCQTYCWVGYVLWINPLDYVSVGYLNLKLIAY